jgi:hypothetical protein
MSWATMARMWALDGHGEVVQRLCVVEGTREKGRQSVEGPQEDFGAM